MYGPYDGYKYTDNAFHQNKLMLQSDGKYAVYELKSGGFDKNKNAHFNKLEFIGYRKTD